MVTFIGSQFSLWEAACAQLSRGYAALGALERQHIWHLNLWSLADMLVLHIGHVNLWSLVDMLVPHIGHVNVWPYRAKPSSKHTVVHLIRISIHEVNAPRHHHHHTLEISPFSIDPCWRSFEDINYYLSDLRFFLV